jgi:5-methylthioadenosine/S-adenosylhomocysteine deaminase
MATINGARAIGLGDRVGSLEAGKKADLVLLDASFPTPITSENVIPQLVTFGRGNFVQHVFVDGKQVVKNGGIVTVDEEEVNINCKTAAESLWEQLPRRR